MKCISVQDLNNWRTNEHPHQLIDIREDHEIDIVHINGERIKMAEILDNLDKIKKDIDVIIHCRSGARSGAVVLELSRLGYSNVHNLTGGILAWANEIDLSLQSY
ncbi:MAG: rhodanese-like domain-containing protein [Flavobacteriales bacterium]|nr:rhodanese-like domain-containing protein [Flavobacteriales bacterium]